MGLVLVMLTPMQAISATEELTLAIQPILSEEKIQNTFQPLADYIAKATGRPVKVETAPNFLSYWNKMIQNKKNMLYFDAAHFTSYRAKKRGFRILAKIPDTISYSVIVRDTEMIFEPITELMGKTIASLGSPSIGAARLNGMFPNPMRQPIIVEVPDFQSGIKAILENRAYAAILPTPIVSQAMDNGSPINVVMTTEPIPHIALSASPDIDINTVNRIRQALIGASKREDGKIMLKKIGFPKFDPASPAIYKGQDKVLQAYWGY